MSTVPNDRTTLKMRVFVSRVRLHIEDKQIRRYARWFFLEPCDPADNTPLWLERFEKYSEAISFASSKGWPVDLLMSRESSR
jgi:hypothetical protein